MDKRALFILSLFLSVTGGAYAQSKTDSLRSPSNDEPLRVLTGNVDNITTKRMNKGLLTGALDALHGQAVGVTIADPNNTEAMLHAVRVRGTTSLTGGNDPLVIIDGVYADLTTLSNVFPADIERFQILKDASETSQYGSRGASGVIVVDTKKGRLGDFHISYDVTTGPELIYKQLKMLSADGYRAAVGSRGNYLVDKGFNTDFQDAITRTGFVQNHHIAFGGGTNQSNYRASLGFMQHNQVIQTIGSRNFTAKFDISQKGFDDRLQIDLGVFGNIQKNKYILDVQKLFYSAASFNPTFRRGKNPDGTWAQYSDASQITNPQSLLDMLDHEEQAGFNAHVRAAYDLGSGLKLSAFGSYSYSSLDVAGFNPTYVWSHGQILRGETRTEALLGNISLTFNRFFGRHRLEALALGEASKNILKAFHTQVSNLSTNATGYYDLSAGAVRLWEATGSSYENPALASFLGRITYTYDDRYALTINTRADGSSKVGRNNRWGFFPSVAGAWTVSKEPWMRNLHYPIDLKLRAGYGLSGNLAAIDCYNSLELLKPNGIVYVDGTPTVTIGLIRNANPDLKWEIKKTFNVGVDLSLFSGRFLLTLDYYNAKTKDMLYLYDVSVPPFAYDKLLANLGAMRNSGLEIGLAGILLRNKDVELNLGVNLAFQQNKLLSLSGMYRGEYLSAPAYQPITSLTGAGFHGGNNNIVYQIVGQPLGVFYLPHCKGLIKNADGTYRYDIADLDGDGVVNIEDGGDRYIAGQATPKVLLGANLGLRYKDFDVSMQINGAFGHKIYNATALTYMNVGSLPFYNVMQDAPARNIYDQTATDYWLEKGDYIHVAYLNFGWMVPLKQTRYIRSLRLSFSINNLLTLTGYSGLTPMINSSIVGPTLGTDDKRSYPLYRSYALGVSIQF